MKERPILFSAPMVRALLDGSKTQTRRVVKMPPSWDCVVYADCGAGMWPYASDDGESPTYDNNEVPMVCPYGLRGYRLWVRESFWGCDMPGYGDTPCVVYDDEWKGKEYQPAEARPWARKFGRIPSIHMPREASRILLEIVSVHVERLNDISEADALAEGIDADELAERQDSYDIVCKGAEASGRATEQSMFRELWESINGAGSWDANPWVWVVEFKRVIP